MYTIAIQSPPLLNYHILDADKKVIAGFTSAPSSYWRPLSENPNYRVYPDGRIYSVKTDKFLKGYESRTYMKVDVREAGKRNSKYIHRIVAETFLPNPANLSQVDHIDRNRINNHSNNLRWVTHQTNSFNRTSRQGSSSRYLGVSLNKTITKWQAQITIDKKIIYLGVFICEEDAAQAYLEAKKIYHK